jgi:hypothetical protein
VLTSNDGCGPDNRGVASDQDRLSADPSAASKRVD